MVFNSLHFGLFFIVVTTMYFLIPYKFRWALLLAASCYFYMVFVPVYILILFFTIIIDYFAGIYIENSSGKKRKFLLIISILSNVLILAFFKYYNFLNENLSLLLNGIGYDNYVPNLEIILPIGLSFHTFQAMSYTIEVYRGNQKAEKHFGIYALYVMFYPQLVAGPIERPQNMLHQFYQKFDFDYARVTDGLKLMAWGIFKKVVIADRLAVIVDMVYNSPQEYEGLPLILATVFFAFQIYCDFSAYSDIALGASQVMGFKLMKNFNKPYFSKSISEFWSRWHISLSTWFKDYLYISIGGNRVSIPRWYFNLFFVFLVSGLWHGANWTFLIWGGLNGVYLIFAIVKDSIQKKLKLPDLPVIIQCLVTFCLVTFAWIFFRANNLQDANYIVTHLFTNVVVDLKTIFHNLSVGHGVILNTSIAKVGIVKSEWTMAFALILFLIFMQFIDARINVLSKLKSMHVVLRFAVYFGIIFTILFLYKDTNQQFIYFQF